MKKCPQCGRELDDSAKFCTGCGTSVGNITAPDVANTAEVAPTVAQPAPAPEQPVVENVVQPAAPPAPPKEKKPIDYTLFNKCFWVLYIVVGALAFLCIELGGIYTSVSVGFTVFLGVMSIIFALGFAAIGVVRKLATMKESEEDRKKHAMRDNICLAVCAVIIIYVLIGAIGLFNIAHTLSSAYKFLGM